MCSTCLNRGRPCAKCCKKLKTPAPDACHGCIHWRPPSVLPDGCRVKFSEEVARILNPKPSRPKKAVASRRPGSRLFGHYCAWCRKFFESAAARASWCPDCRPKAYERPREKACDTCHKDFIAKKKVKTCPDCRGVNQKKEERLCRECKTKPVCGKRAKLCLECRNKLRHAWRSR